MAEPRRGPYSRFLKRIRRLAAAGILVVCALVAGYWFLQTKVHDEIRAEIESRFARHYAEHRVSVRDARLCEGRGIEIHGLTITDRSSGTKLVEVEDIFAACAVRLEDLLAGQQPRAEQLSIRGLKVRAQQREDGTWNVQRLWPLPSFGGGHPPVLIEDGQMELALPTAGGRGVWNFRKISLSVLAEPLRAADGASSAPAWKVDGLIQGDHFQSVKFASRYQPQDRSWNAEGAVQGLQLTPEFLAALPAAWQAQLGPLASLRGRVQLDFAVAGKPASEPSLQWSVRGAIAEGEIIDARLPFRLHDVAGRFTCDRRGLKVDELIAYHGPCRFQIGLDLAGFTARSPLSMRVQAHRLLLDGQIAESLPPEARLIWHKFNPSGVIDADVRLTFDGQRWVPEFEVACQDVAFEYYKFPYRVEGTRGTVRLKEQVLDLELATLASGQVATIRGRFVNPGEQHTGGIEVTCDGPIPIDEKLLASIVDPKAQQVVRSLHPGGMLKFKGRFERKSPGEPVRREFNLDIHHGTMRYDKFPYPLNDIEGVIRGDDAGWTFHRLTGRNHSGYLECEGSWRTNLPTGSLLALNIVGTDVPLEDALRDALSPAARRLWADLRPRGSIDTLKADIRYESASAQLHLDVQAQKLRRPGDEGYKISLQPVWFPYRLEEVIGSIRLRDGQIALRNISAVHNDTEISVEGGCRFDDRGGWTLQLSNLIADRLRCDRELLAALPPALGKAITKLNLQGAVDLHGLLELTGFAGMEGRPAARWDLIVDMENGGLRSGLQLDHLHGDVRLVGTSDQRGFFSRGEVNLDSLVFKDVQLTQVRGPLWLDANRLIFGAEAERGRRDRPPRSLTASAFGGTLSAGASLDFDGEMPFRVELRLDHGDLTQMARELAWKNQNIRGRANGALYLTGTPQGSHSWRGNGFVRLYEADIYELPVMLGLLKVLSIRRPDATAFTSSDIDYRIQGEDFYLDRINFNGDLISLKGSGEMNLDRQVSLTFYSLVGHGELRPAALRAILRTASKQLLRISVTGSLDEPLMTREPLPMLKETLDQLFPELANRQQPTRLPPTAPTEPVRRAGHVNAGPSP